MPYVKYPGGRREDPDHFWVQQRRRRRLGLRSSLEPVCGM